MRMISGPGLLCWCLALFLPALFGALPIYLLSGVIEEVEEGISTLQARTQTLGDDQITARAELDRLAKIIEQQRELVNNRTLLASKKGEELVHLKEMACGIEGLTIRHRDALKESRIKVEKEAVPEEEAIVARDRNAQIAAASEKKRLEMEVPSMRSSVSSLEADLYRRINEVEVGKGTVDNDAVYLQAYLGKLARSVDSYAGSYMLNVADCPPLGKMLTLPKSRRTTEDLGLVKKDLLDVLPKMDPFVKPNRVVYKTCAVVGSSGLLLYYRHGAAIDEAEAVIRFNAAPTAGFEDFVGSKTTVRFVNRLHFGFQERPTETVLQQVTTPESLEQFLNLKKELPASRFFMVSPEYHAHVVSELVRPPTNGLYGILFALQRCQKISLHGFYRGTEAHVPYHYFDTDAPISNQKSRDMTEWPLILELVRRSNGRMQFMEPCQMPEEQCLGHTCLSCPAGTMCQCGRSIPVPKPGYCMQSGVADCAYECENSEECPGYANATECKEADHDGDCATY